MRERNPLTEPPRDDSFEEWLRYLVQSSEDDEPDLPFLVSLWSYCLDHDSLTHKQQKQLMPYVDDARAWLAWIAAQDAEDDVKRLDDIKPGIAAGTIVPFPGDATDGGRT